MRSIHPGCFFCLGFVLFLAGCGRKDHSEDSTPELTIYAAASLTDVVPEFGRRFAQLHPVVLHYNFAGSGALAQQILAAPRADLFLSANESWMDRLAEAGKIDSASRFDFASNQLCVVAASESGYHMTDPADLAALPFRFLALGDPDSVPAGQYAKRWLQSVPFSPGATLWDRVVDRISPSPDVRAALAQVGSRHDIIGIVYSTDLANKPEGISVLYTLKSTESLPIRYPAARTATSSEPELAQLFLDFLRSPEAGDVLTTHGFQPVDSTHEIK